MDHAPEQPGEIAVHPDPAEIGDRRCPADGRQRAEIAIAEGLSGPDTGPGALRPAAQHGGDEGTLLLGGRRHARHGLAVLPRDKGGIADDEDLGMVRQGQVRIDLDPSGAILLGAQPFGRRGSRHPGGPDHAFGFDALEPVDDDAPGAAIGDPGAKAHLDPELLQGALGRGGERGRKCGEEALPRLDQHDPGLAGVDVAEIPGQCRLCQLGDGTGELHTGRTAAHHDESELALAQHIRGGVLRLLEGHQDLASQGRGIVDALQARGIGLPFVMAEIGVARAGRHHQPVIADAPFIGLDLAVRPVDPGHPRQAHGGILLAPEDAADGGGDLGRRETGRRHLIEQRLEQVIIMPVDDRHIQFGAGQMLRRRQPRKPATQDHDPGTPAELRGHGTGSRQRGRQVRRKAGGGCRRIHDQRPLFPNSQPLSR